MRNKNNKSLVYGNKGRCFNTCYAYAHNEYNAALRDGLNNTKYIVRELKDMTPEEIAAIEKQYNAKVKL
jgi:hypothetical protein